MTQFTYIPELRWLVGGALLVMAVVLLSYLWAKGRAPRWLRVVLAGLRWLIIGVVVVCLLDPEWVEALRHQQKTRFAVLLDTSRSMSVSDVLGGRLGAAKTWLRSQLNTPARGGEVQIDYFSFDRSLSRMPSLEAANATGTATGLGDALESLLSLPADDPLAGVLLCSDGIENLRRDPEGVGKLFYRKGIPIHALTVGTTNDSRDIILENIQVKRAVPNQAPTKIGVALRSFGYRDLSVPIEILNGNQVVAVQQTRLKDGPQLVEVPFTPRQKGFQVYEVRVPVQPGEWLATNNRRMFGLEVVDPTIHVIYMEGTPQQAGSPLPEWKYLKTALESDPNIKVRTLYREFGSSGQRLNTVDVDPETGEKIYPVEHPTKGFPHLLNELLEYDVIIYSDIRTDSFSQEQLQNMARLVEEYGGGFVMIGGNSAFGKGGYHRTILDRIIPVAMEQENDSSARAITLRVRPAAYTHPLMALGASREETELIWTRKFPMLYGCNQVDRAKPGAVVLGEDASARNHYGPRLILAVQNVGKGRRLAFTSDTTRTWGRDFETRWGEPINPGQPLTEQNCDSRYYRQFWVNAVRWLAAGRMGRTNSPVTLELAASYCAPAERVAATIKVRDPQLKSIENAEVTLSLVAPGKTNLPVKAVFDRALQAYAADLVAPTNGNFTVIATAAAKGQKLGDDRQLLVCESVDKEMADLRARPAFLAKIAADSGGKAFSLADRATSSSASIFGAQAPATVEYRRTPLWDRWWLLGAVLGMLTIEWAARRWSGMA